MSYLHDKKVKTRRWGVIAAGVILIGLVIFFRSGVFRGLSAAVHTIARPALVAGRNIGDNFRDAASFLYSKKSLYRENQNLKTELAAQAAALANYNSVLAENDSLKDTLGRAISADDLVVSAILAKPNSSPYDTLVIDAGTKSGLAVGDHVLAYGSVPIGRIAEVFAASAKVTLYSSPGEKTEVSVGGQNVSMQLVGRGGGNFEMVLPRDFTLENGTEVDLPGITPQAVASVTSIISDPRDAFKKALLISPVNIEELGYVQVER